MLYAGVQAQLKPREVKVACGFLCAPSAAKHASGTASEQAKSASVAAADVPAALIYANGCSLALMPAAASPAGPGGASKPVPHVQQSLSAMALSRQPSGTLPPSPSRHGGGASALLAGGSPHTSKRPTGEAAVLARRTAHDEHARLACPECELLFICRMVPAPALQIHLAAVRPHLQPTLFQYSLTDQASTTLLYPNRSSPPVAYERPHVQPPAEAPNGWVAKLQCHGWPRCGCRVCGDALGQLAGPARQCCCLRCPPGVAAPGESLPMLAAPPAADIAWKDVMPLCGHSSNSCALKKRACWRQLYCALVIVSARCTMT